MKLSTVLSKPGILVIIYIASVTGVSATTSNSDYPTGGHTYEIVRTDEPLIWLDARDSAVGQGGYLAVITDQKEQDAIASLLAESDRAWIGGADAVVESQWRWYTGEDWDYADWDTDQPDTLFGKDFLQISGTTGGWLAASGTTDAFVVEYECCDSATGNVNCSADGRVNLVDITRLIDRFYISQNKLCCEESGNVDGSGDQKLTLADITGLVDHLYIGRAPTAPCPPFLIPPPHPFEIVDVTDKAWDISFGLHYYGMDPRDFNFGLGPDAFPPIIDPTFLSPGDPGYPAPTDNFSVLGVVVDGESRAYRLSTLRFNEVANDTFGDLAVAATY